MLSCNWYYLCEQCYHLNRTFWNEWFSYGMPFYPLIDQSSRWAILLENYVMWIEVLLKCAVGSDQIRGITCNRTTLEVYMTRTCQLDIAKYINPSGKSVIKWFSICSIWMPRLRFSPNHMKRIRKTCRCWINSEIFFQICCFTQYTDIKCDKKHERYRENTNNTLTHLYIYLISITPRCKCKYLDLAQHPMAYMEATAIVIHDFVYNTVHWSIA